MMTGNKPFVSEFLVTFCSSALCRLLRICAFFPLRLMLLFPAHHDISFSRVWENSGVLAAERDTDTHQVPCAEAILGSLRYGNFLCVRVSHIPKDLLALITKCETRCHMLDFVFIYRDALNNYIITEHD